MIWLLLPKGRNLAPTAAATIVATAAGADAGGGEEVGR
jgi:hypothetical protein